MIFASFSAPLLFGRLLLAANSMKARLEAKHSQNRSTVNPPDAHRLSDQLRKHRSGQFLKGKAQNGVIKDNLIEKIFWAVKFYPMLFAGITSVMNSTIF